MGEENSQPGPSGPSSLDFVSALASSFRSSAPIAEEALARDLAECSDEEDRSTSDAGAETASASSSDEALGPTLYRRPSGVAYGTARPTVNRPPGAVNRVLSTSWLYAGQLDTKTGSRWA